MIQYLKHNQVDKQRWDDCIARSLNRRVYAFSWYLDIVCPGWDALVTCDYDAVFPLTWNRKWSVNYLYQPYFAQQLGIFSTHRIGKVDVQKFLQAVPGKFSFAEIQLNGMNAFPVEGWDLKSRLNHELSLNPSYPELSSRYSQNTKRNLKKAKDAGVTVGKQPTMTELVNLFKTSFGEKEGKLKEGNYSTIHELLQYFHEHGTGHPVGAYSAANQLSAAAFFVNDHTRVYFLFAASSPQARENGAMFFLIDNFLVNNAGRPLTLDFEGGNDPHLGRFYKSFGATEVSYPFMGMNRLPSVVQLGLYCARKIRY